MLNYSTLCRFCIVIFKKIVQIAQKKLRRHGVALGLIEVDLVIHNIYCLIITYTYKSAMRLWINGQTNVGAISLLGIKTKSLFL